MAAVSAYRNSDQEDGARDSATPWRVITGWPPFE